jgi:hypothetical protein
VLRARRRTRSQEALPRRLRSVDLRRCTSGGPRRGRSFQRRAVEIRATGTISNFTKKFKWDLWKLWTQNFILKFPAAFLSYAGYFYVANTGKTIKI